jgi:hypothetical protein
MTQQPRQIERPDPQPEESGNVVPLRVAGLPGADRRILRKRLSRPLKAVGKRASGERTAAR